MSFVAGGSQRSGGDEDLLQAPLALESNQAFLTVKLCASHVRAIPIPRKLRRAFWTGLPQNTRRFVKNIMDEDGSTWTMRLKQKFVK